MSQEPRHLYEYEVDPDSTSAGAYVVQFVGAEKRVLEVGCGPGSITRILANQQRCKVTGMELDDDAIQKVAPFCDAVIRADLNNPDWPELLADSAPFDVVVAADVLEHLYDPWETLVRMASLVRPGGHLVLSLPHVGHAAVVACLLNSNFDYRDWGLLDRTHIRFFGLKNIEALFARAGLKIIGFKYVIKQPQETEFADIWSTLPGELRRTIARLGHSSIYQVVVKAVPQHHPGQALALTGLDPAAHPADFRAVPWRARARAQIAQRLSQRSKTKIRVLLRLFRLNL